MNLTIQNPTPTLAAVTDPALAQKGTGASEHAERAEACRQFEALLLRQILGQARRPVLNPKSESGGTAGSIYRDMITERLSDSMSKGGGIGLARSLEQQLAPASAKPTDGHERAACGAGSGLPLIRTRLGGNAVSGGTP